MQQTVTVSPALPPNISLSLLRSQLEAPEEK